MTESTSDFSDINNSLNNVETGINEEKNEKFSNPEQKENDYNQTIVENAYLEEIKNFFNVLNSTEEPLHSFEKDKYILDIIDIIETIDNLEVYEV